MDEKSENSPKRGLTEAEKANLKSFLKMAIVFFIVVSITAVVMAFVGSQFGVN